MELKELVLVPLFCYVLSSPVLQTSGQTGKFALQPVASTGKFLIGCSYSFFIASKGLMVWNFKLEKLTEP